MKKWFYIVFKKKNFNLFIFLDFANITKVVINWLNYYNLIGKKSLGNTFIKIYIYSAPILIFLINSSNRTHVTTIYIIYNCINIKFQSLGFNERIQYMNIDD